MKKVLNKICAVLFIALLATGLAACGNNIGEGLGSAELAGNQLEDSREQNSDPETYHEWTIEELGATIVAAGMFWEDWWNLRGAFEHIEWVDMDELPEYITATRGFAFARSLPESGLTSLDDVRNYLLQYYTEEWIESALTYGVPYVGSPFVEYDGVFYIDGTRAGFPRPDWESASHSLIEQDGSHVVVETTVLWGSWHRVPYDYAHPWEVLYRFTFVDGRIDAIESDPFAVFAGGEAGNDTDSDQQFALEDLGLTIVRAGWFWEDWWNYSTYNVDRDVPDHLAARGFARVLPPSGLESLDDVRHRLSWNYTENWIEHELRGNFPAFIEYDGVLFVQVARPDVPRPRWDTATHFLVEQDGNRAVVETTVLMETWGGDAEERQYIFTFIDGLIDSGRGMWDTE